MAKTNGHPKGAEPTHDDKQLATVSSKPPAYLAEYEAEAGAGTSQAAEDNLVPLLYVLQPMSPQVDRRNPAYVEGAEPGDIWLRNAPAGCELVKGDKGCVVQPCYFYKDWGEWIPRQDGGGGSGFVGRHLPKSGKNEPDVPGARQDPEDKFHWTTADGAHDLVETRNHAVLVYAGGRALPYLIPLTSTGHVVSRQWMMRMNDKIIAEGPSRGRPYPSYAYLYKLTTEQRQNALGRWFSLVVADDTWATEEQAAAGRKLHAQFKSGEKVAEAPVEAAAAAEFSRGGGDDMKGDSIPF